ncbi:hypothetical protein ZYGR_0S00670 [Zygosaccharomyces rouxii]|nr:hypothetical protein ZYGR_0S00670 [Zygosaccharomyces rouxii]
MSDLSSFIHARCLDTSAANSSSRSPTTTTTTATITSSRRVTRASKSKNRRSRNQSRLASGATTTAFAMVNNGPERVLCSIFELSRDIGTKVGICVIKYHTGEMILSDYMDSQIYIRTVHNIQVYQPTEILLPSSSLSPVVSKLATIIKFNVDESVRITETSAKYFNSQDGLTAIDKYMIENDKKQLLMDEFTDKAFALNATAAAMYYTGEIVSTASNSCLTRYENFRIKYEGTENTMLIDPKTIRGLELVENNVVKQGLSFWKFMDNTCTKMGQRSLRNNILQPLTDKANIDMRLQTVKELLGQHELLDGLRTQMRKLQDLDKLFAKLLSVDQTAVKSEQKINYSILLKDSIAVTKNLRELLSQVALESTLLTEARDVFCHESIDQIEQLIHSYINEDCVWASSPLELENQRCYAVKCGANGLLDVSRQIYKNVMDEIIHEVEELSVTHDLIFDYNYDSSHGFFLRVKRQLVGSASSLPPIFINRVTKKNYIECNTLKIVKYNARLKEVLSEISIISEQVVDKLLTGIVKNISVLFMVSEAVSILDLMCCFAFNSRERNYCIPVFSNQMILQNSRHPVVETLIKDFIPNNISNTASNSLQIITGCNMSGKSVYLRQVVLLCIMAQMGCPIPADCAYCKIYTKIHARICNDSMELSTSTFAFEMKEMAYFLDDIDSSTLLVLDELGRGSSIGDGFCISLAVAEHLLKIGATIFLSTHFQDIPSILKYKPSVVHLNMLTDMKGDSSLEMHYRLSSDPATAIENPGIKAVQKLFSPTIIEEAYRICERLQISKSRCVGGFQTEEDRQHNLQMVRQMKKIFSLVELLGSQLDNEDQFSLPSLKSLQDLFVDSFEN